MNNAVKPLSKHEYKILRSQLVSMNAERQQLAQDVVSVAEGKYSHQALNLGYGQETCQLACLATFNTFEGREIDVLFAKLRELEAKQLREVHGIG